MLVGFVMAVVGVVPTLRNTTGGHDAPFEGEGSRRSHCDEYAVDMLVLNFKYSVQRELDDSFVLYIIGCGMTSAFRKSDG